MRWPLIVKLLSYEYDDEFRDADKLRHEYFAEHRGSNLRKLVPEVEEIFEKWKVEQFRNRSIDINEVMIIYYTEDYGAFDEFPPDFEHYLIIYLDPVSGHLIMRMCKIHISYRALDLGEWCDLTYGQPMLSDKPIPSWRVLFKEFNIIPDLLEKYGYNRVNQCLI